VVHELHQHRKRKSSAFIAVELSCGTCSPPHPSAGSPVLTAWSGGAPSQTVCDAADLGKLSSIAGNGIVSIQPGDLTTCFGTDVTNGDIQVTVQGGEEYLTAKARVTRNDVTSEISLGRLGETNETF
jgi:hypothetical protein